MMSISTENVDEFLRNSIDLLKSSPTAADLSIFQQELEKDSSGNLIGHVAFDTFPLILDLSKIPSLEKISNELLQTFSLKASPKESIKQFII